MCNNKGELNFENQRPQVINDPHCGRNPMFLQ